ncbi:MAG: bifunctional phosphopantothenoylcysteine decarboxylase/phosphopantothenate--cysteine ligase CoaBC [Dehalococcoidia bacterium]|nr:bifunctional phosphopantothenoylcysteine decarboxylase/phosphopantothenate--cysteine ligase CoaBC [Dehalococcoidia bacterium]
MSAPSPADLLPLAGRHVVLGVTGSIAAYKAADLCSRLRQLGAAVEVVMTPAAARFVTPLTFQALTGRAVVVDVFAADEAEAHVEVARRADAFVVAPATADCLANLASGQTPDMVALTGLATRAPLLVAPAMDNQMWEHPATRANVETLRERGVHFVGPGEGRLASGRVGPGRLAEPAEIAGAVRAMLGQVIGDLRGRHVVVSAGPTQEPIDPVRFVGNHSSGRMGFAIAEAARDRGARVTLVAGPVAPETPYAVERVAAPTVAEMLCALEKATASADALIMAAAPVDFRPLDPAAQKLKKLPGQETLTIRLGKNPDILATLPGPRVRVGFAAETENLAANAVAKLAAKRLDFIVGNDVTAPGSGFGTETNEVTIFYAGGTVEQLPLMSKYAVAHAILDRVAARL